MKVTLVYDKDFEKLYIDDELKCKSDKGKRISPRNVLRATNVEYEEINIQELECLWCGYPMDDHKLEWIENGVCGNCKSKYEIKKYDIKTYIVEKVE